jgi:hypothetical protein
MILKYSVRFLILFLILFITSLSSQSKKIKFDYDLVITFDKSIIVDSSKQAELRKEVKDIFNKERLKVVDSIDYSNYNEHYSTFILSIKKSNAKISVHNISASGNYTASVLYPTITFNYESQNDIIKNVRSYIHKYLKK